jgi:hypothetical protein
MVKSRRIFSVAEENHGIIGVADKTSSAAEMIISNDWVTTVDDVWCCNEENYISISDAMERLGYPTNDESFHQFVTDMLEDKIEGYEWGFHLRTISFYEEV